MALILGIDEGAGPLVVLVHGFPETPVSWHHQIGPLVEAGYRVVAPWLRGYGPSKATKTVEVFARPTQVDLHGDPEAFTANLIAGDLAGVPEGLGYDRAAFIGHDWGAASVWATAQLRPERVAALAALSVPYTARSQDPPLARLAALFTGRFFYMLAITEPGSRVDADLSANVEASLRAMYASWSGQPPAEVRWELPADASILEQLAPGPVPWLAEQVLAQGTAAFSDTGFGGALAYYRAMDLTWNRVPAYGTTPVTCPSMFLGGELDAVLRFTPTRAMAPPLVTDLRADIRVPGVGHWVQQEAPEATTAALLEFLASAYPASG